jgi:hypothetical protein
VVVGSFLLTPEINDRAAQGDTPRHQSTPVWWIGGGDGHVAWRVGRVRGEVRCGGGRRFR